MSVQEMLDLLGGYPIWITAVFVIPPTLAWILSDMAEPGRPVYWLDYMFSTLVYIVAIPGTISAVLIGYALFFIRQNLLEVNFLVYFLPVISMVATFFLLGRKVSLDRLPGFDRLSGLMMLIAFSFIVVLLVFKLRILVGFFASIETLFILGLLMFIGFKYAAGKLFK